MPLNKSFIIKKASDLLTQRDDVLFAYLFGSYAGDRATPYSDIDVAVYLDDALFESVNKMDLVDSLSTALGVDAIDLVILNQAPITLAKRVLEKHIVLIDRSPTVRHQFESLTMRKYFDFSILEKEILERRFLNG
jgi:predicted nucleotidyltransferase